MSVQAFTKPYGGKVAINLDAITHAEPTVHYPSVTPKDPDPIGVPTTTVYFTQTGATRYADSVELLISYEDFVFAWIQATTPPPPVQIRSAR